MSKYVNVTSFIMVILLMACLYFANYFVTPWLIGPAELETAFRPKKRERFAQERWLSGGTDRGDRYAMGQTLACGGTLIDLTVEDLLHRLGKPSYEERTFAGTNFHYRLAAQKDYPAQSIFFPDRFWNADAWYLEIQVVSNKVICTQIIH